MDEAKLREIHQWLIKAKHDIGSAKCLSTGNETYPDTAVYHCQQAAEKVLKSYLTLNDTPFQKIHDLTVLISQCMESDESFEQLVDIAEMLTPYATAFRYPGDVLEPAPDDVSDAIRATEIIIKFVLERMPEEINLNFAKMGN